MPRLRRRGAGNGLDAWPGYVDALSTFLIVIMFILMVFVLAQGLLSAALSGRTEALDQVRRQLAEMSNTLALERGQADELRLRAAGDLAAAEARAETSSRDAEAARGSVAELSAQVEALRTQLAEMSKALDLARADARDEAATIDQLGAKLNAALASKVEELERYRSEFFGRLRALLANRPGVQVVGDRFVFQSEVLFPQGSADLTPAGQDQIRALAATIKSVAAEIPPSLAWVLRVDGHADRQPVHGGAFASNWELSAARAITVVKLLIDQGVPASRLAATGFGDNQPLDPGDTPDAYARNRRIELRLTDR
jgi:chemotaxis protein MotB